MNSDLVGSLVLLAYYLLVVSILPLLLRYWFHLPKEYVRKIHHIGYSLSIFLLLHLFSSWYIAVGASLLLVILGYPFLFFIERRPFYRKYFVYRPKGKGELRKQLLYVQLSFALLIFIFWGLLGAQWYYVAAVAVMAWGFGDAAAALVGKAVGKRHVIHQYIESAKTYEGTAAMMLVSGIAMFLTLVFYGGLPWLPSLLISSIGGPVCGVVELFSRRGMDTLTVPLSVSAVTFPIIYLFTFLGG